MYKFCNGNEVLDIFYTRILNAINSSKSLKILNSKSNRLKNWMTSGLLYSVRKKQELSLKAKKQPNNINLIKYYKNYRNKLNLVIKSAKINYYNGLFKRISGDTKNLIKDLTNNPYSDSNKIKHFIYNGNLIYTQKKPLCLII